MRWWHRPAHAWVAFVPLICPSLVRGFPEPPPEVDPGADYATEARDSVPDGALELAWQARGEAGRSGFTRQERVGFRTDSLEGEVREGASDPLGAAELANRGGESGWAVGRLSPRWGNGLLLGTPAVPWDVDASDRGERAPVRGRSGDGIAGRGRLGPLGVEGVAGRFATGALAGTRVGWGTSRRKVALHQLVGPRGALQSGVALGDAAAMVEWASDARGRWRGEMGLAESRRGLTLAARLRLGNEAFRSLAEPRRAGPSRIVTVAAQRTSPSWTVAMGGAQWQWRRGDWGSRLAASLTCNALPSSPVRFGWEVREGMQRERASPWPRRQSWWGELETRGDPVGVGVRHEHEGEGAWGTSLTREVTTLRVEGRAVLGLAWSVTHTVYQSRPGAGLYVGESEPGRLVMRALAGRGRRSTARLVVPARSSRLELQVNYGEALGRASRLDWNVRWVRRARMGGRSAADRL